MDGRCFHFSIIVPSLFHFIPSFPCLLRMKPWNRRHEQVIGWKPLRESVTFHAGLGGRQQKKRAWTRDPQAPDVENLGVPQWTSSLVDPGLGSLIVIAFMVRVLVRQWSSHFSAVEMIGDETLRKCGYVGICYIQCISQKHISGFSRIAEKKLTNSVQLINPIPLT